ncbi:hypothetical protein ACQY0O_007703 [Thecaphora frezii]
MPLARRQQRRGPSDTKRKSTSLACAQASLPSRAQGQTALPLIQDGADATPSSIIAHFYPLVISLPRYVERAFGIDLFGSLPVEPLACSSCTDAQLARYLVAIPDHAAALRLSQQVVQQRPKDAPTPQRRHPIRHLVHRAQLSIVRALARDATPEARKSNVLTLGYSKPDERIHTFNALAPGQLGLANHFPNTIVTTILTAPEWATLLERIGDDNFHHLLCTTAVFAPVRSAEEDGSCFVQMCGQPLSELPELAPSSAWSEFREPPLDEAEPPVDASMSSRRCRKRKRAADRLAVLHADGVPTPKVDRVGTLARTTSADSSTMLSELDRPAAAFSRNKRSSLVRSFSQIAFVRSRIFYARPIRSRKGKIELGLPFVHVLTRSASPTELSKVFCPSSNPQRAPSCYSGDPRPDQTFPAKRVRHILKYVFPRQFGLHNVFTTPKDARLTTQPLNDYTNRDAELRSLGRIRTPNRLRPVQKLIAIMVRRHDGLDYKQLLDRCCPSRLPRRRLTTVDKEQIANDLTEQPIGGIVPSQMAGGAGSDRYDGIGRMPFQTRTIAKANQPLPSSEEVLQRVRARTEQKPRFVTYAVPSTGQVVHFVTTVVRRLIPRDLFGSQHNQKLIMKGISRFVRARRFETLTLHQTMQGLRMTDVDWTLPPGRAARWQRPTAAESAKRSELFAEFLYWLFDSLVMPLLRTTFYATESAAFRNRVLFFRQDDWHAISRPLLDKLKATVFEPLSRSEALAIMSSRKLGYSHIRLLPKETGVRPIVNLRRRSTRQPAGTAAADVLRQRKESKKLGQSINFILQSAFHILTYEKKRCTANGMLGASVFGPNEIYSQLKQFRQELDRMPGQRLGKGAKRRLYFVKVDVQCAFDSIDQDRLVEIIQEILNEKDGYLIHRFAKVMPSSVTSGSSKTKRAYVKLAQPDRLQRQFVDLAAEMAAALHHVVFVDSVVYRHEERARILNLLRQHVMGNLVKIGGDFYRQAVGIPQGSSLSTMLCSFFYAHLERTKLGFVRQPGSLLMRYTDDFLLITTSKRKAKTFYHVMEQGHTEYGCFIAKEKTLVNFDLWRQVSSQGANDEAAKPLVQRCTARGFPWCGFVLDTSTLAVEPDLERYRTIDMRDTLTVESSRRPGEAFIEKLLQATRSRCHILFTDTSLNSQSGVYGNLYSTFVIAALKYEAYLAELHAVDVELRAAFRIEAIQKVVQYTTITIARRAVTAKKLHKGARCVVVVECVRSLGYHAFLQVLTTQHLRRPSRRRPPKPIEAEVVRRLSTLVSRPMRKHTNLHKLAQRAWDKAVRGFGWV